jgi:hypothetical protein
VNSAWRGACRLVVLLLLPAWAWAQDVPVPDGELDSKRRTFDASEYESLETFRQLYEERLSGKDAELDELRRELEDRALKEGLVTQEELDAARAKQGPVVAPVPPDVLPASAEVGDDEMGGETSRTSPVDSKSRAESVRDAMASYGRSSQDKGGASPAAPPRPSSSLDGALVFDVSGAAASIGTKNETVVPAGSYVKVRILTGVEANPRDEIPMLVQADHALVGPNKRRIDLRGCMVLLQVKGELSTDRVVGQAVRLSCVRSDGESVTRDINGYLTGEDSTFGVTGQLISRQGRVIAAAAVAGFAEAAGDAVARAQETRQIIQNPLGGSSGEVRNVTGNQAAYVLGTSGSGSAQIIANWYLKYADQLLPAIAVGSGRDVWVVLLETVSVPPLEAR